MLATYSYIRDFTHYKHLLILKDDSDDVTVISIEGSASDNTSFKSGPAEAFDP